MWSQCTNNNIIKGNIAVISLRLGATLRIAFVLQSGSINPLLHVLILRWTAVWSVTPLRVAKLAIMGCLALSDPEFNISSNLLLNPFGQKLGCSLTESESEMIDNQEYFRSLQHRHKFYRNPWPKLTERVMDLNDRLFVQLQREAFQGDPSSR